MHLSAGQAFDAGGRQRSFVSRPIGVSRRRDAELDAFDLRHRDDAETEPVAAAGGRADEVLPRLSDAGDARPPVAVGFGEHRQRFGARGGLQHEHELVDGRTFGRDPHVEPAAEHHSGVSGFDAELNARIRRVIAERIAETSPLGLCQPRRMPTTAISATIAAPNTSAATAQPAGRAETARCGSMRCAQFARRESRPGPRDPLSAAGAVVAHHQIDAGADLAAVRPAESRR